MPATKIVYRWGEDIYHLSADGAALGVFYTRRDAEMAEREYRSGQRAACSCGSAHGLVPASDGWSCLDCRLFAERCRTMAQLPLPL
jgi:hypothetical protein